MIYIRSALFFLFLICFTILYALSCFVVNPFLSISARYNYVRGWSFGVIKALQLICGVHYKIIGMENMTAMLDEPVILMSKHQSAWETIAYISLFPKQLCYVFKKELLMIPFFGWAMAMLRMIHIDRAQRDKASIAVAIQGKQRLSEGCWIIIYPEGTRAPVGQQIPYRKGGARLAVDTGANVIPIAHNAGTCWPKNSFLKYPGSITISIGPAMSTIDKNPSVVIREIEGWIEQEMRQIDPISYN
jgi:1-acyl-sn-glycerol-3-phosphate acyltransferase